MSTEALKPCPFCGANPDADGTHVPHATDCFINLMLMRARYWLPGPGVMEKAWNTRFSQDACRICGYHPGSSVCSAMHAAPLARISLPPVNEEFSKEADAMVSAYWQARPARVLKDSVMTDAAITAATDAIAQRIALCFSRGGAVPAMSLSKLKEIVSEGLASCRSVTEPPAQEKSV